MSKHEHHNYRAYLPDLSDFTKWDAIEDDESFCEWCGELFKGKRGDLCDGCLIESIREVSQGTPE